ncbi:inverse autotransporter beta domain-containing protein [Citrobacter enshiensis]|nr:inverse autotransporter beta domain-containing protein [Citrobacter enshiensis]WET42308.1 inverse autotransporter beta domain-containing protein [Citrobacter enshiensis]
MQTSAATSVATGYASSSVQQWLSQFGTARVQLNVDENGNWDDSSIDFLAPLYDNKKSMLFTQLGLRAPDGRVTGKYGDGGAYFLSGKLDVRRATYSLMTTLQVRTAVLA